MNGQLLREREALRQRLLLGALWHPPQAAVLDGWLREDAPRAARGLAAYRANGEAVAARALAAAYPTVAALLGDEAFALLARSQWRAEPPARGDLAWYGATLPAFIERQAGLASLPYLPDVARLDWAVHRIESAADAPDAVDGLPLLGSEDPDSLVLDLREGVALLRSRWPVAAIWQAHRLPERTPGRFAAVQAALAAGQGEHALVRREGWRAVVEALAPAEAEFTAALLAGRTLAQALDAAGAGLSFEAWLLRALQGGWIAAVRRHPNPV